MAARSSTGAPAQQVLQLVTATVNGAGSWVGKCILVRVDVEAGQKQQSFVGPWCPTCGAFSVPLVYGLPTREASEVAEERLVVLGECVREDGDTEYWRCRNGHDWVADHAQWLAAIMAAICARPACPICGGPSAVLLSPSDPDLDAWMADLAAGVAVVADAATDPGRFYRRRCHDCHRIW